MMISSLVDVMQYCKIDVIRQMASSLFNRAQKGAISILLSLRKRINEFKAFIVRIALFPI